MAVVEPRAARGGAQGVRTIRLPVREGLTLVADAMGDAGAPRIILLHGGAQNRRAWHGAMRALARAGFCALSLDARGHGDSDWAPDGRYALEDWADDLKRIVAYLVDQRPGPIALVGASRGGQACLLTATARPDLVACVALVDVTPRTSERGIAMVRAFLERSAQGFDSVQEAGETLSIFMQRPMRADASGLERIMRRDSSGRLFWQWDPRMAHRDFVAPPSEEQLMFDAASHVKVPVLLIRAGNSELVREEDVDHFRALTPGLEVVEIPGIGHMLTGDNNDAFMPPVIEFLKRIVVLPAAVAGVSHRGLEA